MQRPIEDQESVAVFVTIRHGKTYVRDYQSIRTGLRACMSDYLIAFYITNRRRVKSCIAQLKKNSGNLLRNKQFQCFPIFDTVLQFTEIFEGRHYRRLDMGGVFEETTQPSFPECHNSGRYGYIKPKLYYFIFGVLPYEFKEGTSVLTPGEFFELRWNPEKDSPIVLDDCVRLRTTSAQYSCSFEILSGEEVMGTVFNALDADPRAEIIIPAIIYKFGANITPSISDIITFDREESEETFSLSNDLPQSSLDFNIVKQFLTKLLKDDPEILNSLHTDETVVDDNIIKEVPAKPTKNKEPLIPAPMPLWERDEAGDIKEKIVDPLIPSAVEDDPIMPEKGAETLVQFLYSEWPALEEFDKSGKRVMRPFFRADKLTSANDPISEEKKSELLALNEKWSNLNESQAKAEFDISFRSLTFCKTKLEGCFLGIDKDLTWAASLSSDD